MEKHPFIFQPGFWLGEGKITFSTSQEELHFYTKWRVHEQLENKIRCHQIVEMQGAEEHVQNDFTISAIQPEAFIITLENDLIGKEQGKGTIDETTIAWEFHEEGALEGFEVFKRQENGEYMVHAEYVSQDQFRSIIEGKIWKKE